MGCYERLMRHWVTWFAGVHRIPQLLKLHATDQCHHTACWKHADTRKPACDSLWHEVFADEMKVASWRRSHDQQLHNIVWEPEVQTDNNGSRRLPFPECHKIRRGRLQEQLHSLNAFCRSNWIDFIYAHTHTHPIPYYTHSCSKNRCGKYVMYGYKHTDSWFSYAQAHKRHIRLWYDADNAMPLEQEWMTLLPTTHIRTLQTPNVIHRH